MRKQLLTMAAALIATTASSQGIVHVGANITVLPSSRWSNEVYSAKTLVINPGISYGDDNTSNPYFNQILGTPADDANGKQWFEPGYDETTTTENIYGDSAFVWEEHNSPFSSDETWGGNPSYRWTTSGIMAEMYLRRTFSTDKLLSGDVYLACGHDDAPCEYYINGTLVFQRTGYEVSSWNYTKDEETGEIIDSTAVYFNGWNNDEVVKLTDEQKKLIKLGGEENLIAVHVHQNWGGAFADCGLYTLVEGGLEMGYVQSWDGKVIYNNQGGYGNSNRQWSPLYEAQAGDVYTVHIDNATPATFNDETFTGSKMEFKTPINTVAEHDYLFKANLKPSCDFSDVTVTITQNDNEDIIVLAENITLSADQDNEFEGSFAGDALTNARIIFNFAGGEDSATVAISDMSLLDETDNKELWVGTSYFNNFYMAKITTDEETGEQTASEVAWPEVEGRTETKAWTLPDFDDEMWDTWAMPVGNGDYMKEVQTVWPGGDNTNLWVRRTFEMDKVNERLSYALNVCHDDNYETYVNGHLLQKNTGWTDGKNPVQVHIPAKYLNVGKNVIATYIQQNWGGRFYDCGINVEEVNYDECAEELKAAIALGEAEYSNLTAAMKDSLATLVAAGKNELEVNKDAAEVKEYAKNLKSNINVFVDLNKGTLQDLKNTVALFKKEDKGTYTDRFNAALSGLDTCVTGNEVSQVLTNVRVARKRNAAERRTENFVGCEPEMNTLYYIYNVGEKRFLGGAESWGTHAATEYECIPMELVAQKDDGTAVEKGFRIHTFRNNGGNLEYLNYGGFVDCATDDLWEAVPVEGKKNVYNIVRVSDEYEETLTDSQGNDSIVVRHSNTREDGSRYYLGLRDGDNSFTSIGFNQWNVVDTDNKTASLEFNQWMFITEEERAALVANASFENPVDVSYTIPNPGYDQRVSVDEWTIVNVDGGVGVWGRNGNYVDFVYEGWNTQSFDLSTTIYELQPGTYKLSVQGFYRDGSYTTHMRKYVQGEEINRFANIYVLPEGGFRDEATEVCETPLRSFTDGVNKVPGMGRLDDFTVKYSDVDGNEKSYTGPGVNRVPDACWSAGEEYFQNGLYWNDLYFVVPENSTEVVIGVYKDDASRNEGDWIVLDNWRLTYYGSEQDPTAISSVSEGTDAPVKDGGIYNLSGQKLQKVQKGVNIVNGRKFVVK